MNIALKLPLALQLLSMADDELILGHRDSEWCGHAPILEEDIAFANLALDEIGHASSWYSLYSDLMGEDSQAYPDRLIFWREPEAFRNLQMVELPNGDWAFSMLRQFLWDASEKVRLEHLEQSKYIPLADAAAKIRKEEIYHFRHTSAWVLRLAGGTEESHRRMQAALEILWPYTLQIFQSLQDERLLVEAGLVPPAYKLHTAWNELVLPIFQNCGLSVPTIHLSPVSRQDHTPHLILLVREMQSVARMEVQAEW